MTINQVRNVLYTSAKALGDVMKGWKGIISGLLAGTFTAIIGGSVKDPAASQFTWMIGSFISIIEVVVGVYTLGESKKKKKDRAKC